MKERATVKYKTRKDEKTGNVSAEGTCPKCSFWYMSSVPAFKSKMRTHLSTNHDMLPRWSSSRAR